jgi:CubicO group peptidase (beta-lactamase class C family)
MKRRFFISLAFLMTLLLPVIAPAMAQENRVAPEEVAAAVAPEQGPADPVELEAFLDDLLTRQLAEHHIAGAAVSVVKDGRLLLARGYGYADVENGIPVDPEQTVFYIGSVGKLFTWTAVMQLVEQGQLDLDADINTYLDFRIPDTYPEPITLRHLLTHTPGFEDLYLENLALDAGDLMPEREWLVSHMPARVRPPGDAAAYSNYGTQLAGYIVARVSGQPYTQYIQEHILDPLGMTHSTAYSPVPPDLLARTAVGYRYVDSVFQPGPNFIGQPAMVPAGSHASTATDMARFMIAHLADGDSDANLAQGRILSGSTVEQMHATLYAPDPRLRGTAYGLFDISENGRRTLGHDGDTMGFKTQLLLLPDENLGIFVAYNGEEASALTLQHFGFQRAFFDHYYSPPAVEPVQPPADFAGRAGRFEGSYRMARAAYTTLEKYRNIMGGVEISDPGDGTLLIQTPWGEWRYVEVEPLYFRQADGASAIVFRADDQGRITHMFMDVAPQFAFEKLKWYEIPGFNMGLVLVCILLFLSVIPVAVIRFIRNRRPGGEPEAAPRGARAAGWILLGICVLNLLFVAGAVLWGEANVTPLFGISPIFKIVLGLGVVSAALTAVALVYTALAWKDRRGSIAGRVYYTLVTAAAVAFVWFLNFWNLLGWRF